MWYVEYTIMGITFTEGPFLSYDEADGWAECNIAPDDQIEIYEE